MKNKYSYGIGLIVIVLAGFFVANENQTTDVQAESQQQSERIISSTESTHVENSKEIESIDTTTNTKEINSRRITSEDLQKLHGTIPSKKVVSEEFNANPHTPSKSLMTFAKNVGPLMEKAFLNESDANLLMKELTNCAGNESVANAARALCVQDVEELAKYHPGLKTKASALRENISPEVQKILDTNEAMIKK